MERLANKDARRVQGKGRVVRSAHKARDAEHHAATGECRWETCCGRKHSDFASRNQEFFCEPGLVEADDRSSIEIPLVVTDRMFCQAIKREPIDKLLRLPIERIVISSRVGRQS